MRKFSYSSYIICFLTLFLLLVSLPIFAYSDPESSGQNTLRPVRRLDFRYEFENLKEDSEEQKYILRGEEQIHINEDFELAFRVDIPSVVVDEQNSFHAGLGDILLQGLAISKGRDRFRYACGARTVVPSATTDETGGEKWDMAAILGLSADTPELGHGSFVSFLMRYRFSLLGAESREAVSYTHLTLPTKA